MTSAVADHTPVVAQKGAKDLSWWSRALRVPLLGKLLGANLVIVAVVVAGHFVFPAASTSLWFGAALLLSFGMTAALVWLALRPIAHLEAVADRVSAGDFAARVEGSSLADRNIARLAATVNRLLVRVELDRARIQYLAGRAVRARDIEREAVARELRDSLAQSVTAISYQLSAARRGCKESELNDCLELTREMLQQLTDEMRSVAETLHPGTLNELGMVNAVQALARRISRRSAIHIEVDADMFSAAMSAATAGALYRVADEALRNVETHAQARHARVLLRSNGDAVLEVEDDGRGMDMKASEPLEAGLGLFSAKAVLALAGGDMQISSAPDLGTRIVARVPIEPTIGRPS